MIHQEDLPLGVPTFKGNFLCTAYMAKFGKGRKHADAFFFVVVDVSKPPELFCLSMEVGPFIGSQFLESVKPGLSLWSSLIQMQLRRPIF